jgi:hypothetical protein
MNKTVNGLLTEMRAVFGQSFGGQSLLAEADPFAKDNKKQLQAVKASKSGLSARSGKGPRGGKDARYRDKKSAEAHDADSQDRMADFHRDADKQGMISAGRPKPKKAQFHGTGSGRYHPVSGKSPGSASGSGKHYPFKRSGMLGKGPGTPPGVTPRKTHSGARDHDEKHCWHCSCGNIYTKGCMCIGTGATKDCPKGRRKPIHINKSYRAKYNKEYHKGYSKDLHRYSAKTAKGKAFSKYGPNR